MKNFTSAAFTGTSGLEIAGGALIEVRRVDNSNLASIFADKNGLIVLSNPFAADDEGNFEFFALGIADGYRVTATAGDSRRTISYVATGDSQYYDIVDLADAIGLGSTDSPTFAMVTITGTPAASTDVATVGYVQARIQGYNAKADVRAMTTTNDTLSGLSARDGVTPKAGDRILVSFQIYDYENGIYVAASGSWTRATDMDAWDEVPGAYVFVKEGTTYHDTGWLCTTNDESPTPTIGTRAINWSQFSGPGTTQLAPDGSVTAPGITFANETGLGFYRRTSGAIGVASGTAEILEFSTSGTGTLKFRSDGILGWSSGNLPGTPDVALAREAANVLALRNGASNQSFYIYGTYTDASNNEFLHLDWTAVGGTARVGTFKNGTGTLRDLGFSTGGTLHWLVKATAGHFVAQTDNTYDIGASGATRPRSIYWGTQLLAPNGSASNPAYGFAGEVNTGFTYVSSGVPVIVGAGSYRVAFNSAGPAIPAASAYSWASTSDASAAPDLYMYRDAANALAQRNGVTGQALRIYNTYTDASNYERLSLRWSGNVAQILGEKLGTGSGRDLQFGVNGTAYWGISTGAGGTFYAVTDNSYDIGATGANRPRTVYVGTSLVVAGLTVAPGRETIYIPAGSLTPRTNNGCAALATAAGATNQPDISYCLFDGGSPQVKQFAAFSVRMPKSWDRNPVTIAFTWRRASGTGAANVLWGARAVAVGDNDTPVQNFGAEATVVDAASTVSASNVMLSGETGSVQIGTGSPPGTEQLVMFEVFRDRTSASDTLTVDAYLMGVTVYYTANAWNDA